MSQWPQDCALCRTSEETADHLFGHCTFAQVVWQLLHASVPKPLEYISAWHWFWQVATDETRRLGFMANWYLWKARNAYLFHYLPLNPHHNKYKIIHAISEWNLSCLYSGPGAHAGTTADCWLPPRRGLPKLNFDGAYNQFTARMGWEEPSVTTMVAF